MAPTPATFDFGRLTFGTVPETNKAGGRYVQVAYAGAQVEYQLGSAQQPLRCPFGAELAARDDPNSPLVMKVELSPEAHAFVGKVEAATVDAANANSQAWFGRPTPSSVHNSCVKPQNGDRPDCLKLKISDGGKSGPATQVWTRTMTANGKLSTHSVPGTVEDIVKGSFVVVKVRIQGGCYFINRTYGASMVASSVLVIKHEGAAGGDDFDLGDVQFVDADDVDSYGTMGD